MQYRSLGKTNIKVSIICLGTAEFSQRKTWTDVSSEECKKIVDFALDNGINFIDTGELYGRSEEILGKVLRGRRDEVILATKIGGYDWDYKTMRERLENSMKRLQTDYVDLYQIHWPKIKGLPGAGIPCTSDMEEKDYDQIQSSMEKLKNENLIRVAGVCNFKLHHLQNFKDKSFEVIATDQVPFNLLWRSYDSPGVFTFFKQKGLSFLSHSSLAVGFLSGKYEKGGDLMEIQKTHLLFNEPIYSRAMMVLDIVKEVGKEIDASPPQVALKWIFERGELTSSLVGVKLVEELKENLRAVNIKLTKEQMERLDKASLDFWKPMPLGIEQAMEHNTKSNLKKIGIKI